MSQHPLPPLQPGLVITVGWDNPMQTFFAQVLRETDDDDADPTVLWCGSTTHEINDPEGMRKSLAPYAVLTDDMIGQLHADRTRHAGQGPTALQISTLAVTGRSL